MSKVIEKKEIILAVTQALAEDVGSGDITAALCSNEPIQAKIISRETAILCGQAWFVESFQQVDSSIIIDWHHHDGDLLAANDVVCHLHGPARALVSAERTALNFLQTLSATATVTHEFMQQIATNSRTKLLDTRKTIPGLRRAQKYAVLCGGGMNHRIGLFDAYLIKENHIAACGSITQAVSQARTLHSDRSIEVEVENIDELRQAMSAGADRALLDNFSYEQVEQAVVLANSEIELEVSGNIEGDQIARLSALQVDYISSGALTKHIRAIDYSMRFQEP